MQAVGQPLRYILPVNSTREISGGGLARLWKNKAIEGNKKTHISIPHKSLPLTVVFFPKVTWMCRLIASREARPYVIANIELAVDDS